MVDAHWRNTQKPARFFAFDARSFAGIMFFLVYARDWTLALAGIIMLIFWGLERRGLTFEASLRAFRCWSIGNNRPANSRRAIRRWVDFHSFDPVDFLNGKLIEPPAKTEVPVNKKKIGSTKKR